MLALFYVAYEGELLSTKDFWGTLNHFYRIVPSVEALELPTLQRDARENSDYSILTSSTKPLKLWDTSIDDANISTTSISIMSLVKTIIQPKMELAVKNGNVIKYNDDDRSTSTTAPPMGNDNENRKKNQTAASSNKRVRNRLRNRSRI